MEGKLKGYENFNVEYVNGERGKVLKQHEKLEVENVNGKRGKVLKRHENLVNSTDSAVQSVQNS